MMRRELRAETETAIRSASGAWRLDTRSILAAATPAMGEELSRLL